MSRAALEGVAAALILTACLCAGCIALSAALIGAAGLCVARANRQTIGKTQENGGHTDGKNKA